MRRLGVTACIAAMCALAASRASAAPILWEAAFNHDGAIFGLGAAPLNWNFAGFDAVTGLGTITAQITGAGDHSVLAFLDIELSEEVNTFFNEFGDVFGAAPAGLSWEIDEPGWVFGDIYTNFVAGSLDNANALPAASPDDVSVALGWAFSLAADDVATLTWLVSLTQPLGGFYLAQIDPDSHETVYFSTSVSVQGGQASVPEPATLLLLGTGLILGARRFTRR